MHEVGANNSLAAFLHMHAVIDATRLMGAVLAMSVNAAEVPGALPQKG